ncbi:DUF1993 family protein [uncultured Erythrobacter sp.]|uniref:DUF1993 domain-containing protein n=1 Tax=uncultured Erythrobacter sp. TaxID=263913 RepID=UPI0026297B15|nr:DUF1993 domain-containing protein [uncultured Erythrobacter sp.]
MTLQTHTISTWRNMLRALSGMLGKAAAHESAGTLMEGRLADDMLPFATQIRMLANFPRQALNSLANADFVSNEEDPTSLEDAKARIAETLAMLDTVADDAFIADEAMVDLDLPNGMKFRLSAADYVRDWAFPNFYFHVSIAYAIMRSNGVELGKADLVPHMMQHLSQAPG